MAEVPEIEMKMTMDYDPKQIYKDSLNNYIKVKFSLKAYQNGEFYKRSNSSIYLKMLSFNGDIKEEQMQLENFETSLKAGEIKEYFPTEVEKAKLALKGFLR